jgi:uncharacterized protein
MKHKIPSILLTAQLTLTHVMADPIKPVVPQPAQVVPLSSVRLTGGPLKKAQDLDRAYLLELQPDRMLFHLRKQAGLTPKASEGYGGWDEGGRWLTGHIAGHYLSAVSYMYAATGDKEFKKRADYIVSELKEIQDKQGDGYIGGLMGNQYIDGKLTLVDGKKRFEDLSKGVIESGGFDLNGMWSPWYVQHKIYAGLRDAYRYTGNKTALEVEVRFGEWANGILSKLSPEQIQKMLGTEFGGMNETMADLYADTGDKRWLTSYEYFDHHAIVDPLAQHKDILPGTHGNTQIPKFIGELTRYLYTGESKNGSAADFFWEEVAHHHSFATGGHGKDEYFGEPDKLSDRVDGRTDESCNVYNMLKMTRTLFSLKPDVEYANFQERALFNHVLGSIDPADGRVCYMVPIGRGVTRDYQGKFDSFTCCVGSGMESHALHGDGIYYESSDKVWVNLYAPSAALVKSQLAELKVETDFPLGEDVKISIKIQQPKKFTLALRRPEWTGDKFKAAVNGQAVPLEKTANGYLEIQRTWKSGDTISLKLPKSLWKEALPDNPGRVALMWGPLVLAGDLGPEDMPRTTLDDLSVVPVFVTAEKSLDRWIKPIEGKPGHFKTDGVGKDRDIELMPFYELQRRTYAAYWDIYTPDEWKKKSAAIAEERERHQKLEHATVAFAQPGEMQTERDFHQRGEDSTPDRIVGRAARRGKKWFSFDLPVDPAHPMAVVATYYNDEWSKRTFDIYVDDQKIGSQVVEKGGTPRFFDAEYAIPQDLVKGKQKVTVKFVATEKNEIAAVFGIRMIRADAAR